MKRHLLVAGTAFALTVLSVTAANADPMKYTYLGEDFTIFTNLDDCDPSGGDCTSVKSITAEFIIEESVLSQAPGDIKGSVTSWSISDGHRTVTHSDQWNVVRFDVGTDANGVPNNWFINIAVPGLFGEHTEMRTQNNSQRTNDFTQYCQGNNAGNTACDGQGVAENNGPPGNWSVGPVVALTCNGFDAPMNKSTPVKVRPNRVLPFRATLTNDQGQLVDDLGITALPLVDVDFEDDMGGEAIDVSDDALPGSFGTEGNQFEFVNGKWVFNLVTKNYSAPGTYTVSMLSGDSSEYEVDPTCSAQFVVKGKKK